MKENGLLPEVNQAIAKLASQVLVTAQEMARKGLVVATWGNVSARVTSDLVLITPSGMDYEEITPADLVVVDLKGVIVQGHRRPSTEMPLHSAIYRQYPKIQAIVHTHSLFASVLAVARIPLPPILEELAQMVGGTVPVSDYAPAGSSNLAQKVVKVLGPVPAALLANHGLVTVGKTLSEALLISQVVEKGAQVYTYAQMLGSPHLLPQDVVKALQNTYQNQYGQGPANN